MKNLSDLIKIYDNVISPIMCKDLIKMFEEKSEYKRPSDFKWDVDYRKFLELDLTIEARFKEYIRYIYLQVNEVYQKYKESLSVEEYDNMGIFFPKTYGFEKLRMKKYEANDNDQFGWHADVGDYISARRFLVMFMYLNDVEVGGETSFTLNNDLQIKPKCGTMVVFPPMWMYPHIGKKPISGPKYIISCYMHYQ